MKKSFSEFLTEQAYKQNTPDLKLIAKYKEGTLVETTEDLFQLPKGSKGQIVEDYGTGFFVKYFDFDYKDGYDKATELHLLKIIG